MFGGVAAVVVVVDGVDGVGVVVRGVAGGESADCTSGLPGGCSCAFAAVLESSVLAIAS